MHISCRRLIFRLTLLSLNLALLDIMGQIPLNGLVGGWPFNGNALDMSGNGNHGTPFGATLANDRFNNSNFAYYFDGVNDYIQMQMAGPTGSVSRSLSFWMKSANSGSMTAFSYGSDNGNDGLYEVFFNNWCLPGIGFDNSQHYKIRGHTSLCNNNWHHIVIVLDSTIGSNIWNLLLYIDGSLYTVTSACASSFSANIFTGNQFPITVGRNSNDTLNCFSGYLDDFFIYDRVLTAIEVQNIYNACGLFPSGSLLASQTTTQCPGAPVTFSTNAVLGALSYLWYLPAGWMGSSTSNTISVVTGTASGVLGVAAMNGCGHSQTSTINVSVLSVPVLTVQPSNAQPCVGSTTTLTASGANSYTWSSGSNSISITITPTSTTIYSCSVAGTNSLGCSGAYIFTISAIPLPTITLMGNDSICVGDTFTINPSGATNFTFSSGTPIVSPSISTVYSVTGTAAGCSSANSATMLLLVHPKPNLYVASTSPQICSTEIVTLTVTGANSYTWNNGSNSSFITQSPSLTTTYSITGSDLNGCVNFAIITQSVDACVGYQSQNAYAHYNIYPNPNNGKLMFESDFLNDRETIEINNSFGRRIYFSTVEKSLIELNISDYPAGVYFISIYNSGNLIVREKILKL